MSHYFNIFLSAYKGYANWLWYEITHPHWKNYFWWLVCVSVIVFALEWLRPWRKDQPKFRKDFFLDVFYMFFNFYLFSLIIYNAASEVIVNLFHDVLAAIGIEHLFIFKVGTLPVWTQLLILFVARDFVQWNIHRLLHRVPRLWEFHKVHHSVTQMGFAAHLRYHWMENVVYNTLQYIPLALFGFGIDDFFIVYTFGLIIGHLNHANIRLPLGIFKYIFNNPQMHIWHHAYHLPPSHPFGVNFGLTLSCWDYLFGTAYIPYDGRDEPLGFPQVEQFPQTFWQQLWYGFGKKDQ
ncbi:MAG: sterol desaturase family protein [Sphingobacteriales bacterium]|nr:sterol desaturase family protein [Sphingobacteriales bacterium]